MPNKRSANQHNNLLSIIICSIDGRKFDFISRNFKNLIANGPYEIIGIHDAQSLSEGYNRGANQSSGSILIFCHDDIEIVSPDFEEKIRNHLSLYDIVGVAGTSRLANFEWALSGQPHIHGVVTQTERDTNRLVVTIFGAEKPIIGDIQALDGLFIAMRKEVFEMVKFDETSFDGFHGYDLDFTFSAFQAGFRLGVCSDIAVIHRSHGSYDNEWLKYRDRFMRKHHANIYAGEVGQNESMGIYVADKERILAMMHPKILLYATANIRALAARKGTRKTYSGKNQPLAARLKSLLYRIIQGAPNRTP